MDKQRVIKRVSVRNKHSIYKSNPRVFDVVLIGKRIYFEVKTGKSQTERIPFEDVLGVADKVEVQLAYAIGLADPVSISVECYGTSRVPESFIIHWIQKKFNLTPEGIIKDLGLLDIDYTRVSTGGHFRCAEMPWEKLNIN